MRSPPTDPSDGEPTSGEVANAGVGVAPRSDETLSVNGPGAATIDPAGSADGANSTLFADAAIVGVMGDGAAYVGNPQLGSTIGGQQLG